MTTTHLPSPTLTSREFLHRLNFLSIQEWLNLMLRQHFILDVLGLFSNDTTGDFLGFALPISLLVLGIVSNIYLQRLLDPIEVTIKLGSLETSQPFPFYQFNQAFFTLDPTVKSTIIDPMLTCKFSYTEFIPILGVGLQLPYHGKLLLSRVFFTSRPLGENYSIRNHSSTIQSLSMSSLTSGRFKSRGHTITTILLQLLLLGLFHQTRDLLLPTVNALTRNVVLGRKFRNCRLFTSSSSCGGVTSHRSDVTITQHGIRRSGGSRVKFMKNLQLLRSCQI
mmetsp:Transcript_18113/g.29689  ORF Transcript_18113/g.29689 Transcript_18113/m.29689 type:complete len:279 (+) Transcript_18113:499-1335(+)